MEKVPVRLRLLAFGVGVAPERRDELYAATLPIVTAYSQHRDRERTAAEVGGLGESAAELLVLSSAMDYVLKHQFGTHRSVRATTTRWIHERSQLVLRDRQTHS